MDKAPGFDPGREGTLFTLVRIQQPQLPRPWSIGLNPYLRRQVNKHGQEDIMQKLIEALKSFGIEIPEDKQADVKKTLSEHYKNVAEYNKAISKLETERDTWKGRAETAEETLKTFDGIDPNKIQAELATWKEKAETAEKEFNRKMDERNFNDALSAAIKEAKGKNDKAIRALLDTESLMKSKNQKEDIMKALEDLKASEDSNFLFVDEDQQKAQQNMARFTQPFQRQNTGGSMTKDQIMGIKDASERQAAIAANIHLFSKGE